MQTGLSVRCLWDMHLCRCEPRVFSFPLRFSCHYTSYTWHEKKTLIMVEPFGVWGFLVKPVLGVNSFTLTLTFVTHWLDLLNHAWSNLLDANLVKIKQLKCYNSHTSQRRDDRKDSWFGGGRGCRSGKERKDVKLHLHSWSSAVSTRLNSTFLSATT